MSEIIHGEGIPVREAARKMKLSERAVWKMIDEGRIQHYKDGRRRLVVVPEKPIDEPTEALALPMPAAVPAELEPFRALVEALLQRQEIRHQAEIAELRAELRKRDEEIGGLKAKVANLQATLRGMDAVLHRAVSEE